MKRLTPIVALAAFAALAGGCNSSAEAEARDAGPAVDRTYQVGAFDRIAVAGPYDVTVTTGGQPGVIARGGEAVLAETEVVVEGGELKIRPKRKSGIRWNWSNDNKVRDDGQHRHAARRDHRRVGRDPDRPRRRGRLRGRSGRIGRPRHRARWRPARSSLALPDRASPRRGQGRSRSTSASPDRATSTRARSTATTADVSIAGSGNVRARATGTAGGVDHGIGRRRDQRRRQVHRVEERIAIRCYRSTTSLLSAYYGNRTLKPIKGLSNGTVIAIGDVSHNIEFCKYGNSLTKYLLNNRKIKSILGKNFRRKFPTVWITLGYYNKKDKFKIDTVLEDILKQYKKLDKDYFSFAISEICWLNPRSKNLRYPKLIQKFRL